MPRKTPPPAPESAESAQKGVASGDNVVIARAVRRDRSESPSRGIEHTRPILRQAPRKRSTVGVEPAAFQAHLRAQGIPVQRMRADRIEQLADELLSTPVFGHRRSGSKKGTHKPNPEHVRRSRR